MFRHSCFAAIDADTFSVMPRHAACHFHCCRRWLIIADAMLLFDADFRHLLRFRH
jgi:hypothetical protein